MSKELKEVTFKTIKTIKNKEIVLPGDYSKLFLKYAAELGMNVEDKDVMLNGVVQDLKQSEAIFKKTSENLVDLNYSAKSAVEAIKNKDEIALQKIQSDLITLQAKVQLLENELFTDPLTKAYNRKWFFDNFLLNERFQQDGCLAFIDVDNFKSINDLHGHLIGDLVLKYLVVYLKNKLENQEFTKIVRYAGDEFIIIFANQQAIKTLNKKIELMQDNLERNKFSPKNDPKHTFSFSFSYGIVEYNENDTFENILGSADAEMYKNKKIRKENVQ